MRSDEVIALLDSRYYTQLEEIFNFYAKFNDPEINREIIKLANIMQYKSFVKFAQHFNIMPEIVDQQGISLIFNNVVKNKKTYGKDNIKGLTKGDFLEAIVRICILGKQKLGAEVESEGFDMKGVDVMLVEKFLKMLGMIPGEKKGQIVQMLKKIKQESMLENVEEQKKEAMKQEEHKGEQKKEVIKQEEHKEEQKKEVIRPEEQKKEVIKEEEDKDILNTDIQNDAEELIQAIQQSEDVVEVKEDQNGI